jgi:hydroxymethylglutaryl-CoA lyase
MPWPNLIYSEEVMREGFGIADVRIPLQAKIELLEALSDTGLKRLTLGAFVSPRFVPQMACFEALLRRFRPREGVTYLSFIHNRKARRLAEQYAPPLTLEDERFALFLDACDVHQRRNVNRSIEQIASGWPLEVEQAKAQGVTQGGIGVGSAWGSNFMGKFSQSYRFAFLERQHALLSSAGIVVEEIGLHDSQSWCLPHEVEADLLEIKRRWPEIQRFHLHMHNARGMALPAIYAALRTLAPSDTLVLEGTLGGIGGGQYCGNGVASGMAATEDLLHMFEGMGIDTGVDLDKLIDCVWMLEKIVGHAAFGFVSKAGPRPTQPRALYDPNLPAVESLAAARHFKLGPAAYAGEAFSPWAKAIEGPFHPVH